MAVDDSKVQLMAYEQMFASMRDLRGLRLQSFQNPREALERLAYMRSKDRKPCLILLDLNMDGYSGLEFLTALRAEPDWSAIPVVMATSSSDVTDVRKALSHGAQDYLVKPMKSALFSSKVVKWSTMVPG